MFFSAEKIMCFLKKKELQNTLIIFKLVNSIKVIKLIELYNINIFENKGEF